MNRLLKCVLGIVVTLLISTLVCFSALYYFSWNPGSLLTLYLVLLVPTFPGTSLSVYYLQKGRLRGPEEPAVPLKDEKEIFEAMKKEETHEEPSPIPEVIQPQHQIVPLSNPGDAIKAVMQNRVIEALQKCTVKVDINADMGLDGEFKDPKISVSFVTPTPNAGKPKEAPKSEEERERLRRPSL